MRTTVKPLLTEIVVIFFEIERRYWVTEWRCGGVVVSALESRSEGRWFDAQSLPSCCFLGQETLPHIRLSPPMCINGYRRHTAGGIPVMD